MSIIKPLVKQFISPGGPKGAVNIFRYHGISDPSDPYCVGEISARDFAWQMKWIKSNMNVISLDDVVIAISDGYFPEYAACVTFDDGYLSSYKIGLPILESLNMTACFFVSSGYLDGGMMWNDLVKLAIENSAESELHVAYPEIGQLSLGAPEDRQTLIKGIVAKMKYWPVELREDVVSEIVELANVDLSSYRLMLRRDEIKTLRDKGMTVGAHTFQHIILTTATKEQSADQILRDKMQLEEILEERVRYFAYPNGKPGRDFDEHHSNQLREMGFELAVTTAPSVVRIGCDPFQLPRFTPWKSDAISFPRQLLQNYLRKSDPADYVDDGLIWQF